jgi:hypothetical protein
MELKYFFIFVLLPGFIYPVSGFSIHETNIYQDYKGDKYIMDSLNLSIHPLYNISLNNNNYTFTAWSVQGNKSENITFPKKSIINYTFYDTEIDDFIKINNNSELLLYTVPVNVSNAYLSFPYNASHLLYFSNISINMDSFKRDLNFTVIDNNSKIYPYQLTVFNNEIRFYLDKRNFVNASYPVFIYEHTIVVNSSTIQYSSDSEVIVPQSSSTYYKLKTLTLTDNLTGSLNVTWAVTGTVNYHVYTRIYKNGVAWSGIFDHVAAGTEIFTVTDNNINEYNGDTYELWGRSQNVNYKGTVTNFRIMFDVVPLTVNDFFEFVQIIGID